MILVPVSKDSLEMIGSWISSLVSRGERLEKERQAKVQEALKSLMEAVTSTRAYLAEIREHPEKQSAEKQHEITCKWMDAGQKIYPINQDLASTYFLKAEYWSDPDGWVAAGKDDYLVNLDRVSELGRAALGIHMPEAR
jgi:hypothetical protein